MRPAAEKRQGTKSRREVVRRRCRGGYGDLTASRRWRMLGRRGRSRQFAAVVWWGGSGEVASCAAGATINGVSGCEIEGSIASGSVAGEQPTRRTRAAAVRDRL